MSASVTTRIAIECKFLCFDSRCHFQGVFLLCSSPIKFSLSLVRHTNCGPANVVHGRVGAEGLGGGGGWGGGFHPMGRQLRWD